MANELDGTGVTANVLVPGGAADTRMVPPDMAPDRSKLISPEVMVAPRSGCARTRPTASMASASSVRAGTILFPAAEAAKLAGAPAAWQQLGRQAIMPNENCGETR